MNDKNVRREDLCHFLYYFTRLEGKGRDIYSFNSLCPRNSHSSRIILLNRKREHLPSHFPKRSFNSLSQHSANFHILSSCAKPQPCSSIPWTNSSKYLVAEFAIQKQGRGQMFDNISTASTTGRQNANHDNNSLHHVPLLSLI